MDLTLSATGLVLTAPLLAVAAAAVKLESQGPVLFRQERVGKGGRSFEIYKLRTMVKDAGKRGAAITAGGDARVTRVGRLLRATKIDELPQLLNVVRGEMSLVGPRPEVPRYVARFAEQYAEILTVRPGITDEASIAYRSEEEVLQHAADAEVMYVQEVLPRKIAMYQQYVANRSLIGDVSILLRTVWKVVSP